eukprot:13738212-Ditylum_brightwellii.AAC.1
MDEAQNNNPTAPTMKKTDNNSNGKTTVSNEISSAEMDNKIDTMQQELQAPQEISLKKFEVEMKQ